MTKREYRIEAAREIRKAAESYLSKSLDIFKGDDELIKVCRADAKDLRNVAKLLRAGRMDEACRMADGLDTLVRDVIPQNAWDMLHGHEEMELRYG